MDSAGAVTLIQILSNADIFLLIFARMLGLISVMPVIGGSNVPVMARIGFCLILASIVFYSGNVTQAVYYDTIIGYGLLITKEILVGLIIGFSVYFIFSATYLSGFLTDQQIGFAMASVFDPITQTQVAITGNLYYFVMCMLFIVSNGHHLVISCITLSYKALPIGASFIFGNSGLFYVILRMTIRFFILGVTIAVPIIGTILIADLALGVLVKTVPQMNVFVIGMPLKVFLGLFAIWFIVPMFADVYSMLYREISVTIFDVMKVLNP